MYSLLQDLKYALRQLRKAPGFAVTAILTLALGIGANTAVFTLVHAVMMKSLPVTEPGELWRLGDSEMCCVNDGLEDSWALFSYGMYKHFRDSTPAFVQLAAFQAGRGEAGVRRIGSNQPAEARVSEYVSGNYFAMFGLSAYAGRMMTQDDDREGAPPVAVMSYGAWKDKYGSDPSVAGASFAINGKAVTVIGIAPPGFFGDRLSGKPTELWLPLSTEPLLEGANSLLKREDEHWLNSTGRLAPGANPKTVEAQLTTELRQLLLRPGTTVTDKGRQEVLQQVLRLTPGGAGVQVMREQYEDSLKLLLWVTGFVLLIACANLANLMLARAMLRKQELSVRTALGASRGRLMRQALTESLLLAAVGGVVSLGVASAASRAMLLMALGVDSVPFDISLSWQVLIFAFAVTLLTGLLFGLVPAWLTSRSDPIDALRSASRSISGGASRTQKSLVVLQAAFSLTLLCAAGLVIQSLRNMQHQHFGFETAGRYIVEFNPLTAGYKPEQLMPLYEQIRTDLQQIPGVESVSYSQTIPMGLHWSGTVYIQGRPPGDNDHGVYDRVGPGYFDTIGTRIVQGRPITEQDTASSQLVAVVNETFVKKYLEGKNPIGSHFGDWDPKYAGSYEIVGVTEDAQYWSPTEKMHPMYFVPATQIVPRTDPDERKSELRSLYLNDIELRTSGPAPNLEAQVRQALGRINPDLPVIRFAPLAEQVSDRLAQTEMIVRLMSLFGLVALLLAAVGVYGVAAYNVERRRNEIGIRMALGAGRSQVVQMVMRGAMVQAVIGLAIGIPLSLAAGRLMTSQLYGVRAFSPMALAVAALALAVCAAVAGWLPARRAAAVDPMDALRAE